MPTFHFISLLILHGLVISVLFVYLVKKRKLIGFQLAMNLTMIVAGLTAFSTGILFIIQFPDQFTIVTILASFVGLLVGGVFGAIFDYQTALTGFVNGVMMGLMSPMVGSVMDEAFLFLCVSEIIYFLSLGFVTSSIKLA